MWRAALAFPILTLAGLTGLLAGVTETCTGNAPDSLFGFVITLPLNLAGMALLCWKPRRWPVIAVSLLPALLALSYTRVAILLAGGTPGCTIVTGNPAWEPSGEEVTFAIGWGLSAAIFWIGLAYALSGGYRPKHEQDADHHA